MDGGRKRSAEDVVKGAAGKSVYWQIVRGICILAVIMIHCPTGQGHSVYSYVLWLGLRQVVNFPVALFVFMAGYFTDGKRVAADKSEYLISRGGRLLVPYFIWSCLYLCYDILRIMRHGEAVNWIGMLRRLVFGEAATPFYYIIVMIQLTALTPWLLKAVNVKKTRIMLYSITPVYLVMVYICNIWKGGTLPFYATVFPAWFFFYLFGIDCRNRRWDKVVRNSGVRWILAFLLLSFAEAFVLKKIGCSDGFASSQIKFSSFGYSVSIILLLLRRKARDVGMHSDARKVLKLYGDCSYGIFYVHMFVLLFARRLMYKLNLEAGWTFEFSFVFILTTVGSLAAVCVAKKIFKNVKCIRMLRIMGLS